MAEPIRLKEMGHIFRLEGCTDLPAHVEEKETGHVITTAWKLTPEELAAACASSLVVVQVIGTQPPMYVSTPAVVQPEGTTFLVKGENGEFPAATMADAMALLLHAFMNGSREVAIERFDHTS